MRQRPFSYLFTVTKRLIDPGLYRCLVMAFSAAGERERYNLTVSSLLDLTILFVLFARFTLSKKGLPTIEQERIIRQQEQKIHQQREIAIGGP
ncbi:hypothetical protein L2E82_53760 [Cichorium intybus]|nr:hypothetical protein L2E82_53760 [Cichorium intybus]